MDDPVGGQPPLHCEGCNRDNHRREDCRFRTHPDFNERGQWSGSFADRAMRRWLKDDSDIKLVWSKRADGSMIQRQGPDVANPAAPPRQDDTDDRDQRRRRGNDRRDPDGDRRVQGGRGDVVVVDKSIGTKTKVRPVSPVSSFT